MTGCVEEEVDGACGDDIPRIVFGVVNDYQRLVSSWE